MAGMLQILTYMLAFYLVLKGIEILQIGLASSREKRGPLITLALLTLAACVIAALGFVVLQDKQAESLSASFGGPSFSSSSSGDAAQDALQAAREAQAAVEAATASGHESGPTGMTAEEAAMEAARAADAAVQAANE